MTDTSAPPEQIAQGIVREWAEHDLDEHYDSEYMRDTLHSAELEERISIALTPPPVEGVRLAAEEIIGQLGVKGKPIDTSGDISLDEAWRELRERYLEFDIWLDDTRVFRWGRYERVIEFNYKTDSDFWVAKGATVKELMEKVRAKQFEQGRLQM